jgi:hypothetical protein
VAVDFKGEVIELRRILRVGHLDLHSCHLSGQICYFSITRNCISFNLPILRLLVIRGRLAYIEVSILVAEVAAWTVVEVAVVVAAIVGVAVVSSRRLSSLILLVSVVLCLSPGSLIRIEEHTLSAFSLKSLCLKF